MIVGASSMGALRAAECWPAGMRGVGTIYRLYRRGALHSDDEVILVYSSDGRAYRPRSVPLINVRYALSRALRKGHLDLPTAERIVASVQRLHFPERCWPVILSNAGVLDANGQLQALLSSLDLKREDAVRCLRTVTRWLADTPALAERPRRVSTAFIPSETCRQREYDALAGLDREEVKRDLSRWQLVSGRYTRYLLRIAAVDAKVGLAARLKRKHAISPLLANLVDRRHSEIGTSSHAGSQANLRIAILELVLVELWKALGADQQGFAEALWAELTASGELDAEIFRWRAVRDAAGVARGRGLSTRARDQFLAESEIAHAHGFHSWRDLQQASTLAPFPWSDFVAYRDELALAKRLRQELFNPCPFKLE
jgi:TfuA-like protein